MYVDARLSVTPSVMARAVALDPVRRAGVIARAALLEGGDVTTTEPGDIPG